MLSASSRRPYVMGGIKGFESLTRGGGVMDESVLKKVGFRPAEAAKLLFSY